MVCTLGALLVHREVVSLLDIFRLLEGTVDSHTAVIIKMRACHTLL
jgi:hypothetical protein